MSFKDVTKETAYSAIKKLVERFSENYESYKSQNYNETQTRIDFINPMFKALGWDMDNEQGFAESYREVKHEDKVVVGENVKNPDYCFTIQGQKNLFYLEAKKPSVDIKEDIHPAYQVRRYGWTAKLLVSVVTDFEELAVYDTSVKPNPKDNASVARIKYITYDKYLNKDEFDFIWETFSKQRVLEGSFDKYVKSDAKKRGTSSVDAEFIKSLDSWREELAKNITSRNKDDGFTEEHINYAVQNILDRLIFLRICEDRGVEPYGKLQSIASEYTVYQKLVKYFLDADDRYNSGLFRFKKDRNDPQAIVDDITPKLILDDKVLKQVIKELYYPECPYQFSVIPIEILGHAYEQFLGKVIRITKGGMCKVEEKPEVRKAGGVYYTPQHIVEYIVKNTVGKLVEGKKPKDIEKIKIVDPACGSGSFLIGAYKYLLNYHLEYYIQGKQTKEVKNALTPDGRLTTNEKKRILLNNIYGVDIDSQAVEVTKLSLLLKAMEGETEGSIKQQMALFHERVLPTLDNNIKCGNSLIGHDFYDDTLGLDNETIRRKIKPFDWNKAFPEIFNQSGFDAVIGNPPYVKEYTEREIFENIKKSHLAKYYQGKMDLWYFFVCYGIDILKDKGLLGFIAPNNWITNAGSSIMRNKILSEAVIQTYIDFNDYKVFEDASIQTMVFILQKENTKKEYELSHVKLIDKKISEAELSGFLTNGKKTEAISITKTVIKPDQMQNELITFVDNNLDAILNKIKKTSNYVLNKDDVAQGIVAPQDYVTEKHLDSINDSSVKKGDGIFVISSKEKASMGLEKQELDIIKPYFTTSELLRYYGDKNNKSWVIYSNLEVRNNIKNYPNIKKHIDKFKAVITSDFKPYGLHRAREREFFEGEKIISLRKTLHSCFTYTDFPCYVSQTYYSIKPNDIDLKYLTGILNSKLIYFWLYHKGKKQGEQLQVDKEPLLQIPIAKKDGKERDDLIKLVDIAISLNKDFYNAKTAPEKQQLQDRIDHTDKKIDELVYKLYELTDKEIKIIEDSVK